MTESKFKYDLLVQGTPGSDVKHINPYCSSIVTSDDCVQSLCCMKNVSVKEMEGGFRIPYSYSREKSVEYF